MVKIMTKTRMMITVLKTKRCRGLVPFTWIEINLIVKCNFIYHLPFSITCKSVHLWWNSATNLSCAMVACSPFTSIDAAAWVHLYAAYGMSFTLHCQCLVVFSFMGFLPPLEGLEIVLILIGVTFIERFVHSFIF